MNARVYNSTFIAEVVHGSYQNFAQYPMSEWRNLASNEWMKKSNKKCNSAHLKAKGYMFITIQNKLPTFDECMSIILTKVKFRVQNSGYHDSNRNLWYFFQVLSRKQMKHMKHLPSVYYTIIIQLYIHVFNFLLKIQIE